MSNTFELWETVVDDTGCHPLFLLDRGDFDILFITFNKNKNTIITDKKGKIIKSHINI